MASQDHLSVGLIPSERQQLRLSDYHYYLSLPALGKKSRPNTVIDILIAAQARKMLAQSVSQLKYEKVQFNPIRFVYFQRIRKRLIFCIVKRIIVKLGGQAER